MKIADLRLLVQPPTSNLYDNLFTRRLSILLTAVFNPLGITANQVTAVNLFVGIGGCALIGFADRRGAVIGILLLHVYAVLDSVDGELARLRKQFSLKGLYLEDLSAFFMIVGFPLAVGNFASRAGWGITPLVLAATYAVFGRNGMAVARRAIIRSIQTKRPVMAPPIETKKPAARSAVIRRFVDEHLLNHTNIRVVVSTVLAAQILAWIRVDIVSVLLSVVLSGLILREAATIVYLLHGHNLDRLLLQVYDDAQDRHADPAEADGFQLARY